MDPTEADYSSGGLLSPESIDLVAQRWHADTAVLDGAERRAAGNPGAWSRALYLLAIDHRRHRRSYLFVRFGFDATRHRFACVDRAPASRDEWDELDRYDLQYRRHDNAARAMVVACAVAAVRGADPAAAAVKAFFDANRDYPRLISLQMALSSSKRLRDEALLEYSGWAASEISISPKTATFSSSVERKSSKQARYNKRLRNHLRKLTGGGSPRELYRALLQPEELPASLLRACRDVDPDEDPRALLNQATNLIVGGGQRRHKAREKRGACIVRGPFGYDPTPMALEMVGWDTDDPDWVVAVDRVYREAGGRPLAEVIDGQTRLGGVPQDGGGITADEQRATREEVIRSATLEDVELREAVHRLIDEFGLTEREAQVYYLRLGEKWRHPKISAYLGIAVRTSRTTFRHAYRKRWGLKPRTNRAV